MSQTLDPGCSAFWAERGPPSLHTVSLVNATHAPKSSLDHSQFRRGTHSDETTMLRSETDDTSGFLLPSLGANALATGDRCGSSLLQATPSFLSMESKSTNVSFPKTSSTFLLDSHSLLPGPSLLADTPSFIKLTGLHTRCTATPIALTSSPEFTLREPRSSLDSTRSVPTNRNVTVQRLALDLPLSCSSSLSVFLQALEEAAPGWYQSLMDSAIPRDSEPSMTPTIQSCPPSARDGVDDGYHDSSCPGLPPDMMESLGALEAIAACVQNLPRPRLKPKVQKIIEVEDICFDSCRSRQSTVRPAEGQLASPPLTPIEGEQGHQPSFPRAPSPQRRRRRETTGSQHPHKIAGRLSSSSCISSNPTLPFTPAMSNVANHPKLARTLGLGATTPSRLPTPTASRPCPASTPYPLADIPVPHALSKKASSKSLKAPKTPKAFKSIFRSRASAPPVPPLSFAPEYDEAESPTRKPPLMYRFSEAGLRREDRRIDDARRHFSSDGARRAGTGRHAFAAADADSFLVL
ncbi:hypothetical protein BC628DRAFT_1106476 [Trametes gibbosa]|nr:hypothetical protein BC628DRAFT_1106476 [Trametes gibbosa]